MKTLEAVAALGALAQETRLEIVRLLIRYGVGGLPAGGIGEALDLNPATLSFHLSALRNAGLVSSVRASRQIIYSANFRTVDALVRYLMDNCCVECMPDGAEARRPAKPATRRRREEPVSS